MCFVACGYQTNTTHSVYTTACVFFNIFSLNFYGLTERMLYVGYISCMSRHRMKSLHGSMSLLVLLFCMCAAFLACLFSSAAVALKP